MPKNIVVLSDGTGQNGGKGHDTNIYKLFRMLEDRTENQVVFYDQGIGTDSQKVTGSVFGAGFDKNILQCYRFIFDHYESGDKIFLFGFSRGAATVRSLASFIHYFGILPASRPELIEQAHQIYRNRQSSSDKHELPPVEYNLFKFLNRIVHRWHRATRYDLDDEENGESAKLVRLHPNQWAQVEFLGVWDTVPALGLVVSDAVDALLNRIPALRHNYHNFQLRKSVKHACHALSIDDKRKWFWPTVWKDTQDRSERRQKIQEIIELKKSIEDPHKTAQETVPLKQKLDKQIGVLKKQTQEGSKQRVEQVWFGGSHTDVGGGFREAGFSDTALEWMVQKAFEHGLRLYFGSRRYWNFCLAPDATDAFHDPRAGFGKIYALGERNEIWKDAMSMFGPPRIHISVLQRARDYKPDPQEPGQPPEEYKPWILEQNFSAAIDDRRNPIKSQVKNLEEALSSSSEDLKEWLDTKHKVWDVPGLAEIELSDFEIWCLAEKYRADYDDWLREIFLSDCIKQYQDWCRNNPPLNKQQGLPSLKNWIDLSEDGYKTWKETNQDKYPYDLWASQNVEYIDRIADWQEGKSVHGKQFLVERKRDVVYDPDGNALVLYEQDKRDLEQRNPAIHVLAFRDYDKDILTKLNGESYESFQKRAQRLASKKRQGILARQNAQAAQAQKLAELYRIDWDIDRWKVDRSQLFRDQASADSSPLQNPVSQDADQEKPEMEK
jgi:uncharacterized protein (DUF2235 family)